MPANQWQPIDTAPKDGTEFLAYRARDSFVAQCHKVPRDDIEMWVFGGKSFAPEFWPGLKPTHWMPLPEPPK